MKCPACGADVEEGADLCLECGEPMGDSPAARLARSETVRPAPNVIVPPPGVFNPPAPATTRPALTPPAPPPAAAAPGRPAWRKWREEEPEPVRCPGCGVKTLAMRCPNCGTRLRSDDD